MDDVWQEDAHLGASARAPGVVTVAFTVRRVKGLWWGPRYAIAFGDLGQVGIDQRR